MGDLPVICPHREDVQIISFPWLWLLPEILRSLPALLTISETYPRTAPRFTALGLTTSPGGVAIVSVPVCLSLKGDEFFISSPYASYTVHRALPMGSMGMGSICSECGYGHQCQHRWGLGTATASQGDSRSSILNFPCNTVPA